MQARQEAYDGFDKMPIGGVWRSGRAGTMLSDRNPYTGETRVEIPLADASDVDDAYRSAERAQRSWANTPPQERRDVLERAMQVLERRKEEIVGWLVKESGSTRRKAELEWQFTHLYMQEAAGYPYQVEGRILPAAIPGKENRVYRGAVGVVGVISPWNTEYGLSGAVFTRDAERGVRIAKRSQAGMTHVNDWPVDDDANTAFGGEKASGLGRFGGEWALEEFTTDHWVSVQEQPHAYPF